MGAHGTSLIHSTGRWLLAHTNCLITPAACVQQRPACTNNAVQQGLKLCVRAQSHNPYAICLSDAHRLIRSKCNGPLLNKHDLRGVCAWRGGGHGCMLD